MVRPARKVDILIVEDDVAIARLMAVHLQAAGYSPHICGAGHQAMQLLQEREWSLVVLDRMLPGPDGMQVLRWLRRKCGQHTPVLMVTALGRTADRVQGLEEGADDYLPKPFEPEELVARVRALLRRTTASSTVLNIAGIEIDPEAPSVSIKGKPVVLRAMEFKLLYELMRYPGKTRTREYLLDHVWGRDAVVEPRTVDVTVKRLRRALGEHGRAECIETVRGLGYRFAPIAGEES